MRTDATDETAVLVGGRDDGGGPKAMAIFEEN
jgi:hypothetical protein